MDALDFAIQSLSSALGLIFSFAVGLVFSGAVFAGVLWMAADSLPTRLIARKGILASIRIIRRARRVSDDPLIPAWKVLTALILSAFLVTYAPATLSYYAWRGFGTIVEHDGISLVIGVSILLYVVHLVGPIALLTALKNIDPPHFGRLPFEPVLSELKYGTGTANLAAWNWALMMRDLFKRLVRAVSVITTLVMLGVAVNRDASIVALIGIIIALSLLVLVVEVVASKCIHAFFGRLTALEQIALTLNELSAASDEPDQSGQAHALFYVSDQTRDRYRLLDMATALEQYAKTLQRRQPIGVRHPMAHLLHLGSAELQDFLSSSSSLTLEAPDHVEDTIQRLATILTGSTDPDFIGETESKLRHLADRGDPEIPPRSWADRFAYRIDLIDKTTKVGILVVVLALVAWLFLSQQLTAKDAVELLP